MARGRKWTKAEDAAIRRAVRANRTRGITADWPQWKTGQRHARRFEAVAAQIGRTTDAVRKRAQRISEYSYLDHQRIRERRPVNQAEPNQPDADADASPDEARRILAQIRQVTG